MTDNPELHLVPDPDDLLDRMREIASELLYERLLERDYMTLGWEFAENFQELDTWLMEGGYRPASWSTFGRGK